MVYIASYLILNPHHHPYPHTHHHHPPYKLIKPPKLTHPPSKIAEDLAAKTSKSTLIDIFGGAGGNVIPFALSCHFSRIIAIEKDADTLACAQHNAEVYDVSEYITFVHGDSFEYLRRLKSDPGSLDPSIRVDLSDTTIFASPPWGGVNYKEHEVFDLSHMEPYNLEHLYNACYPLEHTLFLPRSSDLNQIAKLAPEGHKLDVVQYCMYGASKAMVVYMPQSASLDNENEDWSVAVEKDTQSTQQHDSQQRKR